MCQSSGDIISDLPRDAIENILTRLSLRDAVRTSILSRRWRYSWTGLPFLVFDRDTFGGTKKTHGRLLSAIFDVAFLYRGSLVAFILSLPGLYSCPEIDQLISFVSKKRGLKEFTLHILKGKKPYKLPSSLFSCAELNHLSLQHCVIKPPISFKGFNRLVLMEISKCSILPDVLSGLISSCPLLEELKVSSHAPTKGHIVISAPNLRKLYFTGDYPSIGVEYMPRLSSCFMSLPVDGSLLTTTERTSDFFKSLHNLPAIEDLKLDRYYVGNQSVYDNGIPRKLKTTLDHLTSLTLWEIIFHELDKISTVLCLIRSSPNLVKLVVDAYDPDLCCFQDEGDEDDEDEDEDLEDIRGLFQVQEWCDVYLNSLREVEIDAIFGTEPELEFIKLLLSISPKLEKMIITTNKKVTDKINIMIKVMCLHRSSTLAKVEWNGKDLPELSM